MRVAPRVRVGPGPAVRASKLQFANSEKWDYTRNMNQEFVTWIKQQIKAQGWSMRETARRAGLSPTPIQQILSGEEIGRAHV